MLPSTALILPAAKTLWEVWKGTRSGTAEWRGTAESPARATLESGAVVIGLPGRACRTFAFTVPTNDPTLFRQLAFAQLERRGLAASTPEDTSFICHVHETRPGHSVLSVDVVLPEGASLSLPPRTRGMLPAVRLFPLPAGRLVLMEEQGRLVLCAGIDGQLVHSQVISSAGGLDHHAGQELRVTSLALQQQGLMTEVTGVELWGDFPADEVAALTRQAGLPVEMRPRPAPVLRSDQLRASAGLLPASIRNRARARRRRPLGWIAAAAVLLLGSAAAWQQHSQLVTLEATVVRMENEINAAASQTGRAEGEQSRLRTTQAQWAALRPALEPRRYPLSQLNAIARCLGPTAAVLKRFESKPDIVAISGTARSAGEAYTLYNSIRTEPELALLNWSMVQPSLSDDGTASFEITGKPR
jgi:hypothetical protein